MAVHAAAACWRLVMHRANTNVGTSMLIPSEHRPNYEFNGYCPSGMLNQPWLKQNPSRHDRVVCINAQCAKVETHHPLSQMYLGINLVAIALAYWLWTKILLKRRRFYDRLAPESTQPHQISTRKCSGANHMTHEGSFCSPLFPFFFLFGINFFFLKQIRNYSEPKYVFVIQICYARYTRHRLTFVFLSSFIVRLNVCFPPQCDSLVKFTHNQPVSQCG